MKKYWYSENKLVTEDEYYLRYKQDQIGNKKCKEII